MKKLAMTVLMFFILVDTFAQQSTQFDSANWQFLNDNYTVERYKGKDAIRLKNNQAIYKAGQIKNGIIEFDVAFPDARAFVGVAFRMKDERNYEEFYLRPHQSGNPDANQYCPAYNGVTSWQLYTGDGYSAPTSYLFENWIHCKLVLSNQLMDVYITDMRKPAFTTTLKRPVDKGDIALYAAVGEARFSDFKLTANEPSLSAPVKTIDNVPGVISSWHVSNVFNEAKIDSIMEAGMRPDALTWQRASADLNGLVNLATVSNWTRTNNTVLVKLVVYADKPLVKKLTLGFSDRVKLYLNNQILFAGQDKFQSRDYRFLGTVGFYDDVYLHLKKGKNELLIAVSEDFGGWGIQAKIEDQKGIRIEK